MTPEHKKVLKEFEKRYVFKNNDGREIALEQIMAMMYRYHTINKISLPEYMNRAHPWLYYNYLTDYDKMPDSMLPVNFKTPREFANFIIKAWQETCWKKKYFKWGILSIYEKIDDLTSNTAALLDNGLTWGGGDFEACATKLLEMQQQNIAQREKEEFERLLEEENRRDRLIQDNKMKEAAETSEDIARQKAAIENDKKRRELKQATSNPVWNSSVSPESPFEEADDAILTDPFEEETEDILAAPLPVVAANQILITSDTVELGGSLMRGLYMLKKINGKNTIVCKDGSSTEALRKLFVYYGVSRYVLLTVSENISQNPELEAYTIISTEKA